MRKARETQARRAIVLNVEVMNSWESMQVRRLFTKDVLGLVEGRFLGRIERAKARGINFI